MSRGAFKERALTVAFDCSVCHAKRLGRHWAAWTVSCATAPFCTVRCGCAERRARPQGAWDVFFVVWRYCVLSPYHFCYSRAG
jgi:hypothetical protein